MPMALPQSSPYEFKNLWDVLLLFLIPIGGGIPGGVLLAKSRGIQWQVMTLLYLLSDIMLAFAFEPTMKLLMKYAKNSVFFQQLGVAIKMMIKKTLEHYGNSSNVLVLIMIAFGVDPMTGRAVAMAVGHGPVTGWMIAIAGDMIYFSLIMVSTLWLSDVLGDGTQAMIVILVLMMIIPYLIRKIRERFHKNSV